MKIIGGKKDYYDYLVGYYGYDENIVYDRRNAGQIHVKWTDRFLFYICGKTVPVVKKGRYFIFDPKDERLENSWKNDWDREWMNKWMNKPTKVNETERQPILCSVTDWRMKDYFIPCLSNFGFAAKIEAHEMYEKIYAYLGWLKDNPEIPNKQNDKEKIVAHGFDKKTSFRPLMK